MPADSDSPQVAGDMRLLATALDIVPKRLSGTAASRPTAASIPVDTIYYATDTGVYSICTGAAWNTMLAAGSWQALTLGSNVSAASGYYTPSARLEGDVVRFKGVLQAAATISVGATVATMPAGMSPSSSTGVRLWCWQSSGGNSLSQLLVSPAGVITLAAPAGWIVGTLLPLDALSYTLS